LDAVGGVKTTKSLTVGSILTNQAYLYTSSNAVTFQGVGTDSLINLEFLPKNSAGSVKLCSNYSKYISIMGGGTTKITTSQGTNATCDLTLESKSNPGRIIFANSDAAIPEKLELQQADGSTTLTATTSGGATSGDIILVPRGLGIVDCKSYTAEYNTGMMSTQTLGTNVNTKVRFDNTVNTTFPAGFITKTDLGGGVYDTFQNTSGRTIALMVTACIRETTFPTGRTLGLWIARTGDSTLQYGQALLPPTTDTTNARALNIASIIRLANTESFSIWAHTVAAGVVIGGNGSLYNRPILSFRLMP
jgi:hypothetical protein